MPSTRRDGPLTPSRARRCGRAAPISPPPSCTPWVPPRGARTSSPVLSPPGTAWTGPPTRTTPPRSGSTPPPCGSPTRPPGTRCSTGRPPTNGAGRRGSCSSPSRTPSRQGGSPRPGRAGDAVRLSGAGGVIPARRPARHDRDVPGPAFESSPPGGALTGRLLVASTRLGDPNFDRGVVLLLDHGDDGALGVVLNRPTPVPVVE